MFCPFEIPNVQQESYREAEFLNEIQTKYKFYILLFTVTCSFALRFIFLQTRQPLTVSSIQLLYTVMEKNLVENHTPFPMV